MRVDTRLFGSLEVRYVRSNRGREWLEVVSPGIQQFDPDETWTPSFHHGKPPPVVLPRDLVDSSRWEELLGRALMEGVVAKPVVVSNQNPSNPPIRWESAPKVPGEGAFAYKRQDEIDTLVAESEAKVLAGLPRRRGGRPKGSKNRPKEPK